MSEQHPIFQRVVELCGFSAYVGPGAVRRSLTEAGCVESASTPDEFRKALPALKRRLEVYLPEEEASARIKRIERYLDTAEKGEAAVTRPPGWKEDETQWGKRRFGKSVQILQNAREGLGEDPDEK